MNRIFIANSGAKASPLSPRSKPASIARPQSQVEAPDLNTGKRVFNRKETRRVRGPFLKAKKSTTDEEV
jgi:hypothetical protein